VERCGGVGLRGWYFGGLDHYFDVCDGDCVEYWFLVEVVCGCFEYGLFGGIVICCL